MGNLEKSVCSLLQSCNVDCYMINGNVKMKDLGINIDDPNQVIEFDILAVVEYIGIIFETTTQINGNKKKIDEFMRKSHDFVLAHTQNSLNLNVFSNIPVEVRNKLKNIQEWRFVYVSTSKELETKQLTCSNFPNSQNLIILNSTDLIYLEHLEECLGSHAKNDIFSYLKIDPIDPEAPVEKLEITAIQLENKKISGTIDSDVFLFQIPASDLLYLAHVPRFGYGDDMMSQNLDNYQRPPHKDKLQDIAKMIKKGGGSYSFPNTVTVVLPDATQVSDWKESVKKIIIPCVSRSIKIIDGQHRIFGYAKSKLSNEDLKKSKIMAVGLRFSKTNKQNKDEARIFVEINREQTPVPNYLILLLGYSVLGETTPTAISAHVISKLNATKGGPLQDMLATSANIPTGRSKLSHIKIVMITNELSNIFLFDQCIKKDDPEQNIAYLYNLTLQYFKILKSNFDVDWENRNESLIFSSKYLSAFMRLLVEYRKKQYNINMMGNKIRHLKQNLIYDIQQSRSDKLNNNVIFSTKHHFIPNIKKDQTTIARFILKYGLN